MDEAIKNAISSGDTQTADQLKQIRDKNFATYVNFKSTVVSQLQSQARAPLSITQDASNAGASVSTTTAVSSGTQVPLLDPSHLPLSAGNATSTSDIPSNPLLMHTRTGGSGFSPNPNTSQNLPSHAMHMTTGVSPQMVAQLQAAEQQRSRLTPFQELEQGTGMSTPGEQPKPTAGNTIWQGMLLWTGFDPATQSRKEVQCQVFASLQSNGARSVWACFYKVDSLVIRLLVTRKRGPAYWRSPLRENLPLLYKTCSPG